MTDTKIDNPVVARFLGLVNRRERWGLSLRGWLFLFVVAISLALTFVWGAHPFLAQTRRENTKILVVEGWVRQFAFNAALAEFHNGNYTMVYTTGGPIAGTDGATNDYNTAASVGAELLVKTGVPAGQVQMVPSHVAGRDRTFSSAVALREWFRVHHISVTSINLLTEDAHARRSRLLFQEAFGSQVAVGIISVRNPDYDPKHWWHYSEGVREILGESIAYVYARFIFRPPAPGQ